MEAQLNWQSGPLITGRFRVRFPALPPAHGIGAWGVKRTPGTTAPIESVTARRDGQSKNQREAERLCQELGLDYYIKASLRKEMENGKR